MTALFDCPGVIASEGEAIPSGKIPSIWSVNGASMHHSCRAALAMTALFDCPGVIANECEAISSGRITALRSQ